MKMTRVDGETIQNLEERGKQVMEMLELSEEFRKFISEYRDLLVADPATFCAGFDLDSSNMQKRMKQVNEILLRLRGRIAVCGIRGSELLILAFDELPPNTRMEWR